jgi:SNF2 family DNA or RNA helicase
VVAQLNARIYRQGVVGKQVRIHQLIASQTVDEAVMKRLESKDASQASLLNAIKEYRIGKNKTARV